MKFVLTLFVMALMLSFCPLQSAEFDSTNRFSIRAMLPLEEPAEGAMTQFDWLLTLNGNLLRSKYINLDAEAVHSFRLSSIWQQSASDQDMNSEIYRFWLRASTAQTELRLGLQRINFGSARLIRPLQWFDRLNPLDLLEETEGAKAALAKAYFDNNSTLWLWAILSDGEPKGNELIATRKDKLDYGLRYEFPLLSAETGLSLNHRPILCPVTAKESSESRLALDIRYDTFAGFWLESAINYAPEIDPEWSLQSMLGTDYTLVIGNGLYLLAETGIKHSSGDISTLRSQDLLSSMMMNYPLGLLDSVHYLVSVNWDMKMGSQALVFRRSYDNLALEISAGNEFKTDNWGNNKTSLAALISYTL